MAKMSAGRIVEWLAQQDPDRPALTHEGRTLTRLELHQRTDRLARAYAKLGVRHDDLVTIALPNGSEFVEAALAVLKLGATPQPVSAALPKLECQGIVELAQPSLLVGAQPHWLPGWPGPGKPVAPPGFEAPDEGGAPLTYPIARYWKAPTSGGSTGRPKLILAAAPAEFDPAEGFFGCQPNGVILIPGPLYHNGPFLSTIRALLCGNHVVLMTRFDAQQFMQLTAQYRVAWMPLVPTMMHRVWRLGREELDRYDLSALRMVVHFAAPCPPWLKEEWIKWLGPERVCELYAGTELQGVTWITGAEWLTHRGSVGKALPGFQFKILDAAGQAVPTGEVGEVYMKPDAGPGTTYRYLGAVPKSLDGWESIGDMGWLDAEGYLYLADRETDMILVGGANIYPAEVEAALDAHPAVRSSAVIGLPDEELGNRVHALVDTVTTVTDEALVSHLAERLVRYKIPRSFERVTGPLRDDAGKVRRSALRAARVGSPATQR